MKEFIKKFSICLFLFICVINVNAYVIKDNNINFQSLTIDDWLWQSLVEYIYQDSFRYIWITSNDGLNRYNGNEFKVYKNIKNDKNSISNNIISSIVEDDNKNLWVGTDGGLNKMNLITGGITRYLVSEEDKIYSNTVVDKIMIDSKNRMWICTMNGLNLYDSKNDKFIKVAAEYLEDTGLQDIAEDG